MTHSSEDEEFWINRCASCLQLVPQVGFLACGECWHVWGSRWSFVLHDARTSWRVMGPQPWESSPPPWWRRLRYRLRLRRPSRIYVCPCCSHDL